MKSLCNEFFIWEGEGGGSFYQSLNSSVCTKVEGSLP